MLDTKRILKNNIPFSLNFNAFEFVLNVNLYIFMVMLSHYEGETTIWGYLATLAEVCAQGLLSILKSNLVLLAVYNQR